MLGDAQAADLVPMKQRTGEQYAAPLQDAMVNSMVYLKGNKLHQITKSQQNPFHFHRQYHPHASNQHEGHPLVDNRGEAQPNLTKVLSQNFKPVGTTDAKDYSGFRHGPNLAPSHTASDGLMKSTEFIPSQHASEDQLLSVNRKNTASGLNNLQNDKLILNEEEEDGLAMN